MINYVFVVQKVLKLKNFLSKILQIMEAIKSLPGQLSTIVHNYEDAAANAMGSLTSSMQSGLNVMSNLSGMSQSVQQQACVACGVSKDLYDKILTGDSSVTNAQIEDTLNKLSTFSSISSSVVQAEATGTDDISTLMPTFQESISPNISGSNFSGVTEDFFKLSADLDTDLGTLSDKMGGNYNSPQNVPEGIKSMAGIPQEVPPSENDLLNRDMKSYAPVVNNMTTENFKKATGFVYEFNNLKSRVNAMTNFSGSIKSITSGFGGGSSSFALPTPSPGGGGSTVNWGDIVGSIADQRDLQAALDAKTDVDSTLDGGEV